MTRTYLRHNTTPLNSQFQNEIETLEVSESVLQDELTAASTDAEAKQQLREIFMYEVMTLYDEMDRNDPDLPKVRACARARACVRAHACVFPPHLICSQPPLSTHKAGAHGRAR